MRGNTSGIISQLNIMASAVSTNMQSINRSIQQNLIDQIAKAKREMESIGYERENLEYLKEIEEEAKKPPKPSEESSGKTPKATFSKSQYVNEGGTAIISARALANALGYGVTWDHQSKRVTINGKTFSPYKMSGDTAMVQIRQIAEALGHTVDYESGGKISIYHEGGIVGGLKNNLSQFAHGLLNTRADEQLAKLKVGEVVTPVENIARYLIPNIGKITSGSGGNVIHIENLIEISEYNNATQEDIKDLVNKTLDTLFDGVKRYGYQARIA